jgi:hypothetical protein
MTASDIDPARSPLQQSVARQRASLHNLLLDPLGRIARRCARVWPHKAEIDRVLLDGLHEVPYCKFLYAMDPGARQVSANASHQGPVEKDFGRDRSGRPYMQGLHPDAGMQLSEAYISLRANRPSVTAVQAIRDGDRVIGYLGADFDLRDLPLTRELYEEPGRWHQMRGDPAIRGALFQQRRFESRLDRHIDEVLPVLEELITQHGVFHGKIHFSSNRATVWLMDDPYRYRLLGIDELVDPDICLAYPKRAYPEDAVIPADRVRPVLDTFRHLRFADETIYLRAGSLNIFNGMVGLNFSCDGSHYIPFNEFLARDSAFWEGIG